MNYKSPSWYVVLGLLTTAGLVNIDIESPDFGKESTNFGIESADFGIE